ncbi:DNA-binding transcriptional MerR regulator [Cytobacillus horneckiae]|uniref:MerR family transcriptional regulator n=1 Tax=Cytobacillus horneckiae TaxID=549687 RepID=UPI0019CFD845|nr:MerR family transcriptional regulator [Cytobacillus horneckiae]MBN6884946.1 MerR family transcriptional regulator [Cytobacillus horneckiae]
MSAQYGIGDFSKKTNTTVRTLHYYDEIGLLKPAFLSDGGRRYYTDAEIVKLQKIVTLKYLGYSLEEIQEIIHEKDWNLKQSIQFQRGEMIKKKQQIEQMIRTLDHALTIIEDNQTIDATIFISLINSIQMENEHREFLKELIPEITINEIYNIPEEKHKQLSKRTANLFTNLKEAYGQKPSSTSVQHLIDELWQILNDLYPDTKSLIETLMEKDEELTQQLDDSPVLFPSAFNAGEEKWVGQALEIYFKKMGLILDEND